MLSSIRSLTLTMMASSCITCSLIAGDTNLDTLLRNSPFGHAKQDVKAPSDEEPLEFRGVLTESGVAYFSIYEPANSRSAWVRLNEESSRNFTARSYDWESRQLTIEHQGEVLTLSLEADNHSDNRTVANAAHTPTPAPPPSTRTAIATTEAQRLNNIAAEIKRRRALRQQAINQTKVKQ